MGIQESFERGGVELERPEGWRDGGFKGRMEEERGLEA